MSSDNVALLMPEIVVLIVALWAYVGGVFTRTSGIWSWVALGGLAVAAWHLARQVDNSASAAGADLLLFDDFSYAFRFMALVVGAVFVLVFAQPAARRDSGEMIGTLLVILAGMMLVVTANDLILLFLALELISIPTYVLLYLARRDAAGQEAVAKYFFLSILSSALLLYGFSLLYGLAGSTNLARIHAHLASGVGAVQVGVPLVENGANGMALVAGLLVFAALAFRIAAAPMHFYAPDVYQGTSSAAAGMLAVAPKIVGIAALVRLLPAMWPGFGDAGWMLTLVVAIATMTIGNVLALWQRQIRRLLAYSSIAHAGYMVMGLAVAQASWRSADSAAAVDGVGAMLFYLVVYALATTGVFAALAYLSGSDREVESLDELAGLAQTSPGIAAAIAVFMFSLAGLPPLAGFFGKLTLFFTSLEMYLKPGATEDGGIGNAFLVLTLVAAVNAAIAAAYYLRVVGTLYFGKPTAEIRPAGGLGAMLAAGVCAVAVILAGIRSGPIIEQAKSASASAATTFTNGPATAGINPAARYTFHE
jgi:NADH-quinone oxidoreductase subunit N